MLEYTGKYGNAKVMLDAWDSDFDVDQAQKTISQIYKCLNHPAFTNEIIFMPDCHIGKGALIGFTMELTDKVIPNVIGVDINCGMLSANFGKEWFYENFTMEELDERIREEIPFGKNVNNGIKELPINFYKEVNFLLSIFQPKFNTKFNTSYTIPTIDEEWMKDKCVKIGIAYDRVVNSIGTLGGGNHFIEIGIGNNDNHWGTIHSGSRQFGYKVCNYHQRKAGKGERAYLEGIEMFEYLVDMVVAQTYANHNRTAMLNKIVNIIHITPLIGISSSHNYIDFNDFIIRKGAISSYKNQKMIIPFNQEDGTLICEGKSNKEWNYSAPHGAGRVNSRTWAKANLNLEDAKQRMIEKGIYFSKLPVDETKEAYKDPKMIEEAIEPTAKIIDRIRPILSCKEGKDIRK